MAYSVGVLSRFMHSPRESHGAAMKHCLRYLRGSTTLGLTFKRIAAEVPRLLGYSDISFNSDLDDGKSITGHIFYLGESPITWCSKSKMLLRFHLAMQSLWQELKLQDKRYGCKSC